MTDTHDDGIERELYPFLYDSPRGDRDLEAALEEVRESTRQKCRDVVALRTALLDEFAEEILAAAAAMAESFATGGKLLAFGNGGSATDAQDASADCLAPPVPRWRALPALALVNDIAIVTAVANDVGFEHVYSRQIEGFASPGDIALGFSTSGNSPSVASAFAVAKRRGMLTIGLAGYDGGEMARQGNCDFCFVVRGEHIPRIQEAQATVWHSLLELIQLRLSSRETQHDALAPAVSPLHDQLVASEVVG